MKYVIIYALDDEARQREGARCEFRGNRVECSGEKALIKNLTENGIPESLPEGEHVFPKDGMRFLEALVVNLDSGYLTTSGILEE